MKLLTTLLLTAALATNNHHNVTKPASAKLYATFSTQDRRLSGFHAIDAGGSFDVYVVQGNTESVRVEADDEDQERIITEVRNGVLKIYTKSNSNWNWHWHSNKQAVYVSVRNIDALSVSGSGDAFFKEGLRAEDLRLRITGSGNMVGAVKARRLDSSVSGSGDVKLSGSAEVANISVSGSGSYSAAGFVTENTTVRVQGSGDATVNVNRQLDAAVSGSGDIRYTGSVQNVNSSKSGSGTIHRM